MEARIERARELRRSLTPQEARLWSRLKTLRPHGFHFRRQAPFRGYYLDFVCFDRRLVVEIDGGQHGEAAHAAYDTVRDGVLGREGFRTMRFWNSDVNTKLDGVMDAIWAALLECPPPGRSFAPSTLPTRWREVGLPVCRSGDTHGSPPCWARGAWAGDAGNGGSRLLSSADEES